MINLSIQDEMDGSGKVNELRNAVGTSYCDNTKLISVSLDGNTCLIEEKGKRLKKPSWLTWNTFFY